MKIFFMVLLFVCSKATGLFPEEGVDVTTIAEG